MTHEELSAAGSPVTREAYARLARWVAMLLDENTRMNLTAVRDPVEAWRLHVVDSLRLLPLVESFRPARLIDVGSGGGAPGLPLACACEAVEVTLLEATGKKVAALARMIEGLGLRNARAVQGRAEVESRRAPLAGGFDALTARAVAPLPRLLGWVSGLLRPGGRAWLFKTSAAGEELAAGAAAAPSRGLRYVSEHAYVLPRETAARVIVEYEAV